MTPCPNRLHESGGAITVLLNQGHKWKPGLRELIRLHLRGPQRLGRTQSARRLNDWGRCMRASCAGSGCAPSKAPSEQSARFALPLSRSTEDSVCRTIVTANALEYLTVAESAKNGLAPVTGFDAMRTVVQLWVPRAA